MKIEITVIIPFYDNFYLLKRCLNSVFKQTFKKYEIIIVYDNPKNKDNLLKLKKFIHKKNNIILIENNKNIGAGYSRNKAIKIATGKFIAFLDSDDTWKINKLMTQYNFMKKNNLSISHTSYHIKILGNKFKKLRVAKNLQYSELIKSCDVGLSTVMLNKNLLKNFYLFPNIKTKEDYVMWLRLSKRGHTFYALKKCLTNWTKTPGSLSSSITQKLKDALKVYYIYERYNIINSIFKVFILSINYLRKQ